MGRIRPVIKYHGGKGLLQNWIRSYLKTDFLTFVEPFGGAANVLLNMPRCQTEVYSDIEPNVHNLLSVVRDNCNELCNNLQSIECAETQFSHYKHIVEEPKFQTLSAMERAVAFFVVKRMSKGGIGKQFSSSKRFYSLGPENYHNWVTARLSIPLASERLQGVNLLLENAFDVIPKYDSANTLFYLDPPYFPDSRAAKKVYDFEMSCEQHEYLYNLISKLTGKIAISGYHCKQYDQWFSGWKLQERIVGNNSNQTMKGQGTRKIECLWLNF